MIKKINILLYILSHDIVIMRLKLEICLVGGCMKRLCQMGFDTLLTSFLPPF